MKKLLLIFGVIVLAALGELRSEPAVGKIPYRGRLTDSNRNYLTGTHDITFSICDSAAGTCNGSAGRLWTETHSAVSVQRGYAAINAGDITPIPLSLFGVSTAYLEIQVGSDPPMSPRIELLPSAYSFNAYSLQGHPYDAFLTTFSAQTVLGDKMFGGSLSFSSLTLVGTVFSTSAIRAGDSTFRTVRAGSVTVAGILTSTSGFTGGASRFGVVRASNISVSGTVTSTEVITGGGFAGVGSTLTLLNASNFGIGMSPNDMVDGSSVTKWNAQGRIDNNRLEVSSVTMFGPVPPRSIIGIWSALNLTTSLTDSQLTLVPLSATVNSVANNSRMTMPMAGIVRGLMVAGSNVWTDGSATFQVFINGSDSNGNGDAVIDGSHTQYAVTNGGNDAFSAGDVLDIRVTTSSNFAPTTAEYIVQIVVEWTM